MRKGQARRLFQKGYIYTLISPRVRPDPLLLPGSGFTKDRGDDSETGGRKRFLETLFLVFVRTVSLGSEPSFCNYAFGLLASPTSLEPPRVAGVRSRG